MNLKQKISYALIGFIVGNAILLFAYFGIAALKLGNSQLPDDLTISKAIEMIESKKVKKANFTQSNLELVDQDQNRYLVTLGSDPTRETLLKVITEQNVTNPSNQIEVHEAASSSSWSWLVVFNLLTIMLVVVVPLVIIGLLIGIFVRLGAKPPMS